MVAAGYALYGSATMMVLSTGGAVNGFTLDPVRYQSISSADLNLYTERDGVMVTL
jgi:fructose-1,6-bisphosphatase I